MIKFERLITVICLAMLLIKDFALINISVEFLLMPIIILGLVRFIITVLSLINSLFNDIKKLNR